MRAVVSTVSEAQVTVNSEVVGQVGAASGDTTGALLVLLGVGRDDGPDAATTMARKIADLRILPRIGEPWDSPRESSAAETGAGILVVSQFTLMGSTARGRRPSWSNAAPGPVAGPVVDAIVDDLRSRGLRVETGVFGASMTVSSKNEGPMTLIIET